MQPGTCAGAGAGVADGSASNEEMAHDASLAAWPSLSETDASNIPYPATELTYSSPVTLPLASASNPYIAWVC